MSSLLTIRLDSELVDVFADPSDLSTVNAAAKCLNASVSGPPPATANNCRNKSMEQWVLPAPDVPDKIIACGYPVSACWRTASKTIFRNCGANSNVLVDDNVNGFPTSMYGLIDNKIGPTFVYNLDKNRNENRAQRERINKLRRKSNQSRKSINNGQLNLFHTVRNVNGCMVFFYSCQQQMNMYAFIIAGRHFMLRLSFSSTSPSSFFCIE